MSSLPRVAPLLPHVRGTLPGIGIIPQVWCDPAVGLIQFYERYGPLFVGSFFGPVVFAIGPEANRLVLNDRAAAVSAASGKGFATRILGEEAVFALDGAAHRRMRGILHAPLKGAGLAQVAPALAAVTHAHVTT